MKLKKILSIVVAAAMTVTALTGAIPVSAETVDTGECGKNLTWKLDSAGVLTISGTGDMNTTTEDTNDDVYTYKAYAEDIKEVVIEEGVTSIGYKAFYQLTNMETVSLPSTIAKFPKVNSNDANNRAFSGCTSLKNLTLTEGMTSLGAYAFENCTSLTSVTIPSTLTDWDQWTFIGCTSLNDVTLPDGLTVLGGGAFENTAVESITIPSSIEEWGHPATYHGSKDCGTFKGCTKLTSVTFGDGIKTIGSGAFADCTSLEKLDLSLCTEITEIGQNCFNGSGITEITLPEGLTELAGGLLEKCTKLKQIRVPDNVVTIQSGTFMNCPSLETAELPKSLVNMSTSVFSGDTDVTVYIYSKDVNYIGKGSFDDDIDVYLPLGSTTERTVSGFQVNIKDIQEHPNHEYHEEDDVITKEVTCTEAGSKIRTCALCDLAVTEEIPAGHDYAEGVCRVCGEKDPDYVPPTSEEPTADPTTNPTAGPTADQTANPTANPTATKEPTANSKAEQAAKDKKAAKKAMKQAKITKLKVKSQSKKKITVSWKKVKKAKGYEVEVSAKKNFKKVMFRKNTSKKKLTIAKKIKNKKTYYVRVRAYATYKDATGKVQKVYSSFSKSIRHTVRK